LALEEEADFCIHLYRQDILTAIQGITQNVSFISGWISIVGTWIILP
jgi:hypothetical protein